MTLYNFAVFAIVFEASSTVYFSRNRRLKEARLLFVPLAKPSVMLTEESEKGQFIFRPLSNLIGQKVM
jgi:hypothetical protein